MKTFFIQLVIVSAFIFAVCFFGGFIDRLPFLGTVLLAVTVAAVIWYWKPKRINNVPNGLGLIIIILMLSSCSDRSYRGLTRTQKQIKFQKSHKPTTNEFYDRKRDSWNM